MARADTRPVPVPALRRESDGANASPGRTPLTSISKQLAQQGITATPQDLIFSMVLDHEQAGKPRSRAVEASKPASPATKKPPRQGRRESDSPKSPSPGPASPAAGAAGLLAGDRIRSDSSTLKRSHWKPAEKAGKCANPCCRRRFTRRDRRSNCCMCGEVFCRPCVRLRRKLSSNAEPDPLGTWHNVCHVCFDKSLETTAMTDLGMDFKHHRSAYLKTLKRRDQVERQVPLAHREHSRSKIVAVREEADRLAKGYQENRGLVRNLLSDVRIPEWQKSPNWRLSAQATHCFHCKKQFRMTNRKIHCRLCGQVFCTDCTKAEIILYIDSCEPQCAKWAVNGKSGGPEVPPQHFELLPICPHCSSQLESILVKDIVSEPDPEVVGFLDQLVPLQRDLLKYQEKVEKWLPKYQSIVDSMDIGDGSPQGVEGRHPLRNLAKAQCDLSDAFSQLAVKSQKLRAMQRKAKTETQEKLLKHVMIATYQFYSENMYLFRGSRDRLAEQMPLESLDELQAFLDQQSMERVHILLQQVMYEALNLQERHKFDNELLQIFIEPIEILEEEFKAFLERKEGSWGEHCEWVQEFVKSAMSSKDNMIKLDTSIIQRHRKPKLYVEYRVVMKCSSLAHSSSRELSAKTSDKAFVRTKTTLEQACVKLDKLMAKLQIEVD